MVHSPVLPPAAVPSGPAPELNLSTPISPTWLFTETELAKMLRLSRRTLQRLRLEGGGPKFVRLTPSGSRIAYLFSDVQNWLRQREISSTSAATVAAKSAQAPGGVR